MSFFYILSKRTGLEDTCWRVFTHFTQTYTTIISVFKVRQQIIVITQKKKLNEVIAPLLTTNIKKTSNNSKKMIKIEKRM